MPLCSGMHEAHAYTRTGTRGWYPGVGPGGGGAHAYMHCFSTRPRLNVLPRSQTLKRLQDFLSVKFKDRQNQSLVLEVRVW